MLNHDIDKRGVATLTLDRADVHNAFNAELIAALTQRFERLVDAPPRVLVLAGSGRSFSAGADLGWMRGMAEAGEDENRADAERLAAMFRALDALPCPVIARVHGPAFGGGVGLVACCDMAIAATDARFGLTEVRLGLIPATIAPFVLARIGAAAAAATSSPVSASMPQRPAGSAWSTRSWSPTGSTTRWPNASTRCSPAVRRRSPNARR